MCSRAQINYDSEHFFIGRKAEFELLHESLEKARSGHTRAVLVTGEAGIGKTNLVQKFIEQLYLSEWHISVWVGNASDVSKRLAFSTLFQVFRSAIEGLNSEQREQIGESYPHLRAFLPGLSLTKKATKVYPTVEGLNRSWLFEMLCRFVLDLNEFQTIMIWIDDLPSADDDTLEWLQFFLLHYEHCRLLFIGTCRTPIHNDVNPHYAAMEQSWIRKRKVNQIILGPLQKSESDELIRNFSGQQINDDLRQFVLERTGGIPLFIIEMLQMVREHVVPLHMELDISRFLQDYVPQQIIEMIDKRIELMPELEQRIMRFLAVGEHSLPWTVLLVATNAPADNLASALAHLIHDGLLNETASDYEILYAFHHPLMKSAVLLRMSATENRQIHKTLGVAWQRDVVKSAYHIRNAGSLVDATKSVPILYEAGLYYLSLRAYQSAAEYFEQAWNATKSHVDAIFEEQQIHILLMLAQSYIYLDRKTEAMDLIDMLYVDSLPVVLKIKLKRFLSWVSSLQSPDESTRHIQEALSYWDGTFENEDIFWMLSICVDNGANFGNLDTTYSALEAMRQYIERFPTALNKIRFTLHEIDVRTIHWSKQPWTIVNRNRLLVQAIEIGDPEVIYEAYCIPGYYQLNIGDYATALTNASECMKWMKRFHLVQLEISVRLMEQNGLLLAGRWTKAESEASAVKELSLEHKADIGLLCSMDFLATLYALQGKWEKSNDCMKRSEKLAESVLSTHPVIQNERKIVAAQAVRMLLNGEIEFDGPVSVTWANTHGLPIFLTLIAGVLNVRAGFTNSVMDTVQNLCNASGMRRPNYMKSVSDLLRGLCLSKTGKTKKALNSLQKSIDGFISLGTPFEVAYAEFLWAGQACDLNPNRSLQVLDQSRRKFEALGAIPFAKLAQKLIDSLNCSVIRNVETGLSARELEIARYIMQGMSNKQIADALQVSPRTVSTHLSNMYRKLEVHNRVSLTAKLNK